MAQDPKQPKPPSPSPSHPGRTGGAPEKSSVPLGRGFAADGKSSSGDLSEDDLRDIDDLLGQEQDVTRQDIPAQNFQGFLDRYTKGKKGD